MEVRDLSCPLPVCRDLEPLFLFLLLLLLFLSLLSLLLHLLLRCFSCRSSSCWHCACGRELLTWCSDPLTCDCSLMPLLMAPMCLLMFLCAHQVARRLRTTTFCL
jgi:hypothetical protein